jgi:hypothetical protein
MMDDTTESPVYLLPPQIVAESYAAEMLRELSDPDTAGLTMLRLLGEMQINLLEMQGEEHPATRRVGIDTSVGALAGVLVLLQYKLQRLLRISWMPMGWTHVARVVGYAAVFAVPRIKRNAWIRAVNNVE